MEAFRFDNNGEGAVSSSMDVDHTDPIAADLVHSGASACLEQTNSSNKPMQAHSDLGSRHERVAADAQVEMVTASLSNISAEASSAERDSQMDVEEITRVELPEQASGNNKVFVQDSETEAMDCGEQTVEVRAGAAINDGQVFSGSEEITKEEGKDSVDTSMTNRVLDDTVEEFPVLTIDDETSRVLDRTQEAPVLTISNEPNLFVKPNDDRAEEIPVLTTSDETSRVSDDIVEKIPVLTISDETSHVPGESQGIPVLTIPDETSLMPDDITEEIPIVTINDKQVRLPDDTASEISVLTKFDEPKHPIGSLADEETDLVICENAGTNGDEAMGNDVEDAQSMQAQSWPNKSRSCYCLRAPLNFSKFHKDPSTFLRGQQCEATMQNGLHTKICSGPLSKDDYAVRFEIAPDKIVALCHFHQQELSHHRICAVCAVFYNHGSAIMCRGSGTDHHFFHRSCLVQEENWSTVQCPHCGNMIKDGVDVIGFPLSGKPDESPLEPVPVLTFTNHITPRPTASPSITCRFNNKLPFNTKGLWRESDIRRQLMLMTKMAGLTPTEFAKKREDDVLVNSVRDDDILMLAFCLLDLAPYSPKVSKAPKLLEAVDLAVTTGHLLCLHLLHLALVPVETVDARGFTPVMNAVMNGQFEIARYLCKECKCDLDRKDKEGRSLLQHLLESSSEHHLIFRLVDYQLATPSMVRILTEENQDVFVPVYLRVHAERLLPEPKDHYVRFKRAVKDHDEETAAMIALFHFSEIHQRPLKEIRELCQDWPSVWGLIEQKWIEQEENFVVCPDITHTKERAPIRMIGRPDDQALGRHFTYVSSNVFPANLKLSMARNSLVSCACGPVCNPELCKCRQTSSRNYADNRLGPKCQDDTRNILYECHELCLCGPNCGNRVIQKGIRAPLEVRKTPNRGWGLFARSFIPEGDFLAEYCGEIVTDQEVNTREIPGVYLFELRHCEPNGNNNHYKKEIYCVDAEKTGNVARFINHSCSPSAQPIWFFHQIQDARFPRIAFFAAKDIHAGDEICFDYGKSFWTMKNYEFKCECGSYECRYRPQPPATVGLGSHATRGTKTAAGTTQGLGKKTLETEKNGPEAPKRRKM